MPKIQLERPVDNPKFIFSQEKKIDVQFMNITYQNPL